MYLNFSLYRENYILNVGLIKLRTFLDFGGYQRLSFIKTLTITITAHIVKSDHFEGRPCNVRHAVLGFSELYWSELMHSRRTQKATWRTHFLS